MINENNPTRQDLGGVWKMADFEPRSGERQAAFAIDYDDSHWIPARVPGNVHTALLEAGRIEEPFYNMNVEASRWVEEREWWYRGEFHYQPVEGPDFRCRLVFEGLDTLCTVYLNGKELGRHADMFIPACFDVTGQLHPGPNLLALRFDPIMEFIGDRQLPDQWTRRAPERALVRKSQYHFGWDWGPRLLTIGPWQGIHLDTYYQARIAGVHFQTRLIAAEGDYAEAAVQVEIESWANSTAGDNPEIEGSSGAFTGMEVKVTLSRGEQRWQAFSEVYGEGRASAALAIFDPQLWWTHDLGTPALYDLEVILLKDGQALDVHSDRVGLRTLTWDQSPDPDEPGARFFAPVLNGVRIFARGANWIPADSFLSEVEEPRYRGLLELAVDANMNMLRAWGGGIFEKDAFYRLCDQLGLLIWQDFMYACALYPGDDPEFYAQAEVEARLAVTRLRNHPSLALWCGNNENHWIDDQRRWEQAGREFPGKRVYHELLPRVLAELDPGRFYWPSSPYGGNDHNDSAEGDRHNWTAWHGQVDPRCFGQKPQSIMTPEGVSYRHYGEDMGRFISEFGLQSLPDLKTLRRNVPEAQLFPGSQGLDYRNKDNPKDKINYLLQIITGLPTTMQQCIDFSMIAQAEGLKFGIEHYRRRKPHCSGALIWQLNDCWPGTSWSLLDYYLLPKASYFFVKRAFAPVLASFKRARDGFDLWIVNDTAREYTDEITWGHGRFTGETLYQEQLQVCLPPNSARAIKRIRGTELAEPPAGDYLYVCSGGSLFPSNRTFLVEVKDLQRPAPDFQFEKKAISDNELEITLCSDRFVYYVKVGCPIDGTHYSDNYFDLYPAIPHVIRLRNGLHPIQPDQVSLSSLPV